MLSVHFPTLEKTRLSHALLCKTERFSCLNCVYSHLDLAQEMFLCMFIDAEFVFIGFLLAQESSRGTKSKKSLNGTISLITRFKYDQRETCF